MKRIRAARHYQRKNDAVRLIADRGVRMVARPMRDSLRHLGTLVPVAEVERYLAMGALTLIKDRVAWAHFREVLKAPFAKLTEVRFAAAALGVRKINGAFAARQRRVRFQKDDVASVPLDALFDAAVHKDIGDQFNFDTIDQSTQNRIRAAQDRLIRDITAQARDTIDTLIITGAKQGLSADQIASDIREFISLTPTQAQAVLNYRSYLQNLDPAALQRQLRNRAYDRQIREAMADGTALDADVINAAVENYRDNYLNYRAMTIAQTESTNASNAGILDAYKQAVDRGAMPADAVRRFWQLADHPCPVCESIPDMNPDGVALDEPFQSIEGPIDEPAVHVNCLPGDQRVSSARVTAATVRWYEGNLIILRTSAGHELACTPNHPILTSEGWIAAASIDVGSDIVCADERKWAVRCDVDNQNEPSTIKQIADSFRSSRYVRAIPVPVAPPDFHGDGEGSDVAIVWTDGLLRNAFNSTILEHRNQPNFVGRRARYFSLYGISPRDLFRFWHEASTYCIVRWFHHIFALLRSAALPRDYLCFSTASSWQFHLFEPPIDDASGHTVPSGHTQGGSASFVDRNKIIRNRKAPFRFQRQSASFEKDSNHLRADAELARNIGKGKFGLVERHALIDKRLRHFSGHVYNLQTETGFYAAEGIITHNCMCSVEVVTDLDQVAQ